MKRLYLMITITNRVVGSGRFVDFYRAFGAPVVFTALGRGTASDEVLSYLGLEATEKSVMFSVVTPACKDALVKELVSTMHLTNPGTGIAMCLPLSSIGGGTAMNYLTPATLKEPDEIEGEDEHEGCSLSADRCHCQSGLHRQGDGAAPAPEPTAAPFCTPRAPAPRMPGSFLECPLPRSGR